MSITRSEIDLLWGPPLQSLADCIRGFLIAKPNHDLVAADFSAVEARIAAWVAGESRVLEIFKRDGDVYLDAASTIFRVPVEKVTDRQRQIGKVVVLAFSFGGGLKAFQFMGKNYGVDLPETEIEQIKYAWRAANPAITNAWHTLDNAAKGAVYHKDNRVCEAGRIKYRQVGDFLFCQLPSERLLSYPFPRLGPQTTPWGEIKSGVSYMRPGGFAKGWVRKFTYGGSLFENVVQAIARDLLAEAMTRLAKEGYTIVLHVHDSIVCEVMESVEALDDVIRIMTQVPSWAKGLPIKAVGYRGKRYEK